MHRVFSAGPLRHLILLTLTALSVAGCHSDSAPESATPSVSPLTAPKATPAAPDTAAVNQTVRAFFTWYSQAINSDSTSEFQPRFVADAQGRMTLDLTRYLANLRRLHFSEDLLRQEAASYQPCIANLRRIPYARRDSLLDDISDYEDMDCAFFDYYRWTRTMDRYQGIRLERTKLTGDSARVWIRPFEYYADNEPAERYYVWEGHMEVRLTRRAGTWEIDAIQTKRP